jgi:DNA-directed RNA polymerase specialized sigma24 family protein
VNTGEPAAPGFERFFAEHHPTLVRAGVAWTADRELADDVAHEVMLAMRRYWRRTDRPEVLMYRIARQIWQRVPSPAVDQPAGHQPAAAAHHRGPPATAAAQADAVPPLGLLDALRYLPLRQREAVVLTVVCALPHDTAAEVLGLSTTALRAHRDRGLAVLKSYASQPLTSAGSPAGPPPTGGAG